jgi:DNA polymerase elongation subunit (family B)
MGLDNENAQRIVFDIETAPLAEAVDYIEPAEAPANYKDPEKIAAAIAAKNAENLSKCGLDVDLCKIVAVAVQNEDMDRPCVWLTATENDERDVLRRFWLMAASAHLIGFNCLGFDLPVLLRRSLYLGVPTPRIAIDKFKHPQVTDLMQVLSFNGTLRLRGLSFYAKRFGIAVEDELTGAGIAEAVAEGRWADVEQHVTADVTKTALIAAKLGLFHVSLVGVA